MSNLNSVDWTTIPAPTDDGGADHLPGTVLPSVQLPATDGSTVDLADLQGRTVIYAYPLTGRPDVPLPDGWDLIPGARGCTPQSCAFRDHTDELVQLGVVRIYGLSTQDTEYQQEAADRLKLPFALLSDAALILQSALNLPVMSVDDKWLLKRLTLILLNGRIEHVFYPVFPPDESAAQVMAWLRLRA